MKTNRKIGYPLSFVIALALFLVGLLIELFSSHKGIYLPKWPINIIILVVFIVYIIALNHFWNSDLKKWFSSIKSTVGAITIYSVLVLVMGFITQNDENASNLVRNLGLAHINRSWYFLLISAYLLIILGFVILKRIKNIFKFRNFAFFLNHFGIWLVIATASVGSADLQRITLPIFESQTSKFAYENDSTLIELPFSIQLNDFYINNFNPNVIFFNHHSREILNEPSVNYSADSANSFSYENWNVEILKIIPDAVMIDNEFFKSDTSITQFAAFVKVSNNNQSNNVWISSGNYSAPSTVAVLDDNIAISLSLPQEKEYTSIITITNDDGTKIENLTVQVNNPYKNLGYDIYQQGFDNINGQEISILEIVKDPWLPVVYVGLIMLTIGSLMLFWLGKKR
ncbi:MAG: cytochrome c biogenesis protein ResB [Bacteroidales bacterium]|nr:cytochrome c biogenesis protein ResB [Bacteroidales bacterium]